MEMTRSRAEGILNSFGKLLGSSSNSAAGVAKQHTFIETDTLRYVYQPIEKLYMVLVTTRASNILEDLETLRLFARVVCSNFFLFAYIYFFYIIPVFLFRFPNIANRWRRQIYWKTRSNLSLLSMSVFHWDIEKV